MALEASTAAKYRGASTRTLSLHFEGLTEKEFLQLCSYLKKEFRVDVKMGADNQAGNSLDEIAVSAQNESVIHEINRGILHSMPPPRKLPCAPKLVLVVR